MLFVTGRSTLMARIGNVCVTVLHTSQRASRPCFEIIIILNSSLAPLTLDGALEELSTHQLHLALPWKAMRTTEKALAISDFKAQASLE